jgi:alkane 1-monooxygenase
MGMIVLSYFPGLYFRVMDPRLMTVNGGDLARINVDPRARSRLEARYEVAPSSPK